MSFVTLAALGLLDSDSEDVKKGDKHMTDHQFKAFIGMCLALAETTRETKEFRKHFGTLTDWGAYAPFTQMLVKIADTTGDMERVKQILNDILKMEGADRR